MSPCSLADIAVALSDRLADIGPAPPVAYIYDPTAYARGPHLAYLERYGTPPREIVLLGMNPGPWGMVQTGVPFGEVAATRDWLGIEGLVGHPPREHPARPVTGFACPRSEVSGRRLWGWAAATFGVAESFFGRFFVANYCPLAFFDSAGRNLTPDRLPAGIRSPVTAGCDRALRESVDRLRPRLVIGIGRFAEARARTALAGLDIRIGAVTHPSPASPKANTGWEKHVRAELEQLGVALPDAPS